MAVRTLVSRLRSVSLFSRSFATRALPLPGASPLLRQRPLLAADDSSLRHARPGFGFRCFSTRPTTSSLNDPSPKYFELRSTGHTSPFTLSLCRSFSSNINRWPIIIDPEIEDMVRDLLAINWDEIPDSVINETKRTLFKNTEMQVGQDVLANVFRAATASVEFSGVLVSLRMALDDLSGFSGENVGHLPEHLEDAIRAAYKKYVTYLDSFGRDETYLRKKVELELGTKMMHLKMRCSGIGSEWGKVTLIGTSGLSGSYVEFRAEREKSLMRGPRF